MVDLDKLEKEINKLQGKRRRHLSSGAMDYYTAAEAERTDMATDIINSQVEKKQEKLILKAIKNQLEENVSEEEMIKFYKRIFDIARPTEVYLRNIGIQKLDERFGEIPFMVEMCKEDAKLFELADSSLRKDKSFLYELLQEGIKVDFDYVHDSLKENPEFKLALVETFSKTEEGKDFDKKILLDDNEAIFKTIESTGYPKLDLQDFIELAKEEKYDNSINVKAEHFEL